MNARNAREELSEREQRFVEALRHAEWLYDPESDEMEIILPGARSRAGFAVLAGEHAYVRLDAETHEPLVRQRDFDLVEGRSGLTWKVSLQY